MKSPFEEVGCMKSPFEKGGFRGICRWLPYGRRFPKAKSPLAPLCKGGELEKGF